MAVHHLVAELAVEVAGYTIDTWYRLRVSISEVDSEVRGYYLSREDAEKSGKGAGWYGGNGRAEPVRVVHRGGRGYEVASDCAIALTSPQVSVPRDAGGGEPDER